MNIVFPNLGDETLFVFAFGRLHMEYIIDLFVLLAGTLEFLLNSIDFTGSGDFLS